MSETKTELKYSEPAYFYRMQLNTPDPDLPTENAAMMFGLDGDTPEVLVWPRGESQKGKGPIKARMNTTAMGRDLSNLLKEAADGEPGFKGTLPVLGNRYEDGKPIQKTVSTFVCGKRKDGVVVIGLFDADETRPRILFPFTHLDWVGMPIVNGTATTEADFSKKAAYFHAEFFTKMCTDSALKQTTAQRKAFQDEIRRRRDERQEAFKNGTYKAAPKVTLDAADISF